MTHPVRLNFVCSMSFVTTVFFKLFSNSVGLVSLSTQDMVPAKPTQSYVPRAYGFKIHSSSLYYRNHEEGTQHPQIETSLRTQRKTKRVGRK